MRRFIHQKSLLGTQWRKHYNIDQTREWGKTNSLSGRMQFGKLSGIYSKTGFAIIQKRGHRKKIVKETENLSVLGLKRRGNSTHRETAGRIKRKHNRVNTSRTGQMVQSNIYNSEASLEMKENSGCECTEQ
ncbi:MAG: hypothetical protein EZS28_025195 [Streblomastix strix]|uniref:Uncharacterized protein n=1 Tax=Streblomastix strix TaxID=222440 RepID=A0A5J4VA28_9EUKA|nr:MAG: hypothetical protein EZS28_025195 [Streblomastix strix]